MICDCCNFKSDNKKSISNHKRMHKGKTNKGKHINIGEKNGMWKGDLISKKGTLHEWIRNHKPKPKYCEDCKIKDPFDLANISQKYLRDINDFEWLCRSCHMQKDGRLNKLHEISSKLIRKRFHGRFI